VSDEKVVIWSSAGFLYGTISSITWNITIVNTTHRRRWDTIIKGWKRRRYLTSWERIDPPRKMLAVNGKIVNIEPPGGQE
jgi:hypothetical protein